MYFDLIDPMIHLSHFHEFQCSKTNLHSNSILGRLGLNKFQFFKIIAAYAQSAPFCGRERAKIKPHSIQMQLYANVSAKVFPIF